MSIFFYTSFLFLTQGFKVFCKYFSILLLNSIYKVYNLEKLGLNLDERSCHMGMLGGNERRVQNFHTFLRWKALQLQLTAKSPCYCCKTLHLRHLWESWICLQTLLGYLSEYHQMRRLSVDVFFVKSTIRSSYRRCSVKKVFLKIS